MKRALFFLAAFLICSATNLGGQTTGKRPELVHATMKAENPDSNGIQKISVTLTIDKGWHIYANPVGNEYFLGNETTLRVYQDGQQRKDATITYPKGQLMDVYGIKFFIYTGTVVLQADIPKTADGKGPLEIRVGFQPQGMYGCHLPKELKFVAP